MRNRVREGKGVGGKKTGKEGRERGGRVGEERHREKEGEVGKKWRRLISVFSTTPPDQSVRGSSSPAPLEGPQAPCGSQSTMFHLHTPCHPPGAHHGSACSPHQPTIFQYSGTCMSVCLSVCLRLASLLDPHSVHHLLYKIHTVSNKHCESLGTRPVCNE